MRYLKGTIDAIGFENLMQMLSANHQQGMLAITRGSEQKTLHLSPAGIRLLASSKASNKRLGDILLRAGKITPNDLSEAVSAQAKTGKPLGEVIVAGGLLSEDEMKRALREQVEEEIYDLLSWKDAAFEFYESSLPDRTARDPLAEVVLDANVTSLLLEAARRSDELALIRRTIPSNDVVPAWITRPDLDIAFDMEPDQVAAVCVLIDERRTVRDIVAAATLTPYRTLRILYLLAQGQYVKFRTLQNQTVVKLRRDAIPDATRTPSRGGVITLFSDLPTFRTALSGVLRQSGFSVIEQPCSAEAIANVGKQPSELFLLDLSLSTTNGMALCEALRRLTGSPIVVLSNNPKKEAVVAAIKAGARDYLVKPFENETLLKRLEGLLRPSNGASAPS